MVNRGATLDTTFGALADGTRRAILARLARGEATVGELAQPFDMSLPAVSKHLRVLESAGLMSRQVEGRVHHCRLEVTALKRASEWINLYRRFWERRFDALEAYLERTRNAGREEPSPWPRRQPQSKPSSGSAAPSQRPAKKSTGRGRSRKR